jgi:hypothetical protein
MAMPGVIGITQNNQAIIGKLGNNSAEGAKKHEKNQL